MALIGGKVEILDERVFKKGKHAKYSYIKKMIERELKESTRSMDDDPFYKMYMDERKDKDFNDVVDQLVFFHDIGDNLEPIPAHLKGSETIIVVNLTKKIDKFLSKRKTSNFMETFDQQQYVNIVNVSFKAYASQVLQFLIYFYFLHWLYFFVE